MEKLNLQLFAEPDAGSAEENQSQESTVITQADETYNQIKLVKENKQSGKREVYIAKDSSNIQKWGKLQYFDTLDEKASGQNKANALLKLYNKVNRTLKFQGVLGDIRVRGGSLLFTDFNLGDLILKNYMMIERVTHYFYEGEHRMDLEVRGKI